MSFAVAADAYDRYMGRYSALLSAQLADFAGVRTGQLALDVGSGPGALTGELVARLGAAAVSAVDPSESFVAAARARHPGVDVRLGAAESLPYADQTFDAALAQLVVHFMVDPLRGLREMSRVIRGDGVVAACVWDFAGGRGPLGPFWEAAHELDPAVVDESGLAGARDGHIAELLDEAGLRAVEQAELTISLSHPTFEAWWAPFTHGVGPGGAYVARLSPDHKASLRDRCRALLPPEPFELSAVAWAARGRR
jgi:ubiquinone/menaquinone biosynthesis C-methylase UbiE